MFSFLSLSAQTQVCENAYKFEKSRQTMQTRGGHQFRSVMQYCNLIKNTYAPALILTIVYSASDTNSNANTNLIFGMVSLPKQSVNQKKIHPLTLGSVKKRVLTKNLILSETY